MIRESLSYDLFNNDDLLSHTTMQARWISSTHETVSYLYK